jgi:cytochrome bd-type quinol oxidase subunit 2
MFQLSVVYHIRLCFATVAGAYERHADAAARLARWSWYVKVSLVTLLALASVLAFVALQRGRAFQIAAIVVTVMGFIGCTVYVALDLEPRIYGHRSSALRETRPSS